jgi:hypothetical protein
MPTMLILAIAIPPHPEDKHTETRSMWDGLVRGRANHPFVPSLNIEEPFLSMSSRHPRGLGVVNEGQTVLSQFAMFMRPTRHDAPLIEGWP